MFTRKRLPVFTPTGDWKLDAPRLQRWLSDYWLSLEPKGSLAINHIADWTPVLTFATPGDLAANHSSQIGRLVRHDDKLVEATFRLVAAPTHTTAAGNLQITGLPYVAATETSFSWVGSVIWSGITKATYTHVMPWITTADNKIQFNASGSGVATGAVVAADVPTGGTVILIGSIWYEIE